MAVIFSFTPLRQKPPNPLPPLEEMDLPGTNARSLILIHGLTGTPFEMRFLAYHFKRKGYSVTCPRLANHGLPIGVLQRSKWQDFYASVRDCFLKLKKEKRLNGPVFVSGLSMGALLALLLAEEFAGEIKAVSCLSPTLFYDGWNSPWTRIFIPLAYATPLKHIAYFKEESPYGFKNELIRKKVHEYFHHARLDDLTAVDKYGYPFFPVNLLHQLHLLVKHLSKKLPNITVPVQVLQAKEDDMTSVKNSEFIYDRIASKKKELFLFLDSYHIITADQERDKVAAKMEEFFTHAL